MTAESRQTAEYREELAELSRRSFDRRLISGTGGNLSVRVPETGTVLITPSGISLAEVTPELVVMVDLEGNLVEAPEGLIPSKETGFHLQAYRLRPEVGAVAHLHPPYATAFANKKTPLPLVTVSARGNLKHVPWIESALPGSAELRDYVTEALEGNPKAVAFLMEEHGVLTLARDLRTAFFLTDLVEDTAKIAYIQGNIKKVP